MGSAGSPVAAANGAGAPWRAALTLFVLLSVLTGLIYPLVVTGIAAGFFARQAAGGILERDGRAVGARLIGQSFSDARHFWGRPSATTPQPYNALASGGSNLGPLNPALTAAVRARVAALRALDPGNGAPLPVDLVTASGSGLDPHISLAAASYQLQRVARARGLDPQRVVELLRAHSEGRFLGFIGEPRVNVLELNLALDALK
jgi:K+-transporting ATPase ATPase C chain